MRARFLGLITLVLAMPAVALADPDDPPPPGPVKPAAVKQFAFQDPTLPAPNVMESPPPAVAPRSGSRTDFKSVPQLDLIDDHSGPIEHWWVNAEYLLWWVKKGPLPEPLLTTGSLETGGVLGEADTQVLLGNSSLDFGRMSGVRVGGGGWLDERHIWGLEADGFVLERRSVNAIFASDANGNPLLSRPINDALADFAPDVVTLAFPGAFAGSFSLSSSSRLWGLEANVLRNLYASPRFRADLVLGFRYLDLDEKLALLQQTQALENGQLFFLADVVNATPNGVPVTSESILDSFHTRNQVYAGQIGLRFEGRFGAAVVGVTSKVALGPNHETVEIAGTTTANLADGTSQTVTGGLLALPGTNIGRSNSNPFVIVPQVDVRVGYQLAEWLQVFVGYDFLFINEVTRPGSQINLNVNTALVPSSPNFGSAVGPNEPSPRSRRDEFWAQGIHFGLEFRY